MSQANRTRASNFTPVEDEQLARSWIEVSEDVLINNSQTMGSFWERVQAQFKELSGKEKETKTLSNRCVFQSISSGYIPCTDVSSHYL
jgi:hypothetical protein